MICFGEIKQRGKDSSCKDLFFLQKSKLKKVKV